MAYIVKAVFGSESIVKTDTIYQYNSGQVLQIEGLALSTGTEIHFAIHGTDKAYVLTGTTKNNVTTVTIPDILMINDYCSCNYRIDAFIYIVDSTSGYTKYQIIIPVKSRPAPASVDFTEKERSEVDSLVATLNTAVTEAKACKITDQEKTWMLALFKSVADTGSSDVKSAYDSLSKKWGV